MHFLPDTGRKHSFPSEATLRESVSFNNYYSRQNTGSASRGGVLYTLDDYSGT